MTKAVQLQVNTTRFIERVLGKLFEHPARAISEAMQNSRRAGASTIRMQIASDPTDAKKSIVIIADDGSGILDWSSLLVVAQSGWQNELADNEDPFGVGFAALLFNTRELLIRSRGRELRVNQAEAVKGTRFAVTESRLAPAGGTVIRLEGYALTAEHARESAERFASGFVLPVYVGDELLPSPYRLNESFVRTPVGAMRFAEVGAMAQSCWSAVFGFFQGLPIALPVSRHQYHSSEPEIVVHIDENAFAASAPDRVRLCEPQAFEQAFHLAVRDHWQAYLRNAHSELSPACFVEGHWRLARTVGCDELLDQCPVLPSSVLFEVADIPRLGDITEFVSTYGHSITRAEVESGQIVLAREPKDMASEEALAFLTLAHLRHWVLVRDLPETHWASAYVVSIDDTIEVDGDERPAWSVEVGEVPRKVERFCGYQVDVDVSLVDRYSIALADPSGRIVHSVETDSCGLYWQGALVVPAKEDGDWLVRQVSWYRGENEEFLERELESDNAALQDLIAELRGRSAAATVHKLLSQTGAAHRPGVAGTACIVIFGAEVGTPAHKATHVFELSPASIDALAERYPVEAAPLTDLAIALAPLVDALSTAHAANNA